jgi:hypothetical protein
METIDESINPSLLKKLIKLDQIWKDKVLAVVNSDEVDGSYYLHAQEMADKIIPKVSMRKGSDTYFTFNKEFFEKHQDRCLKVATIYCLALFGSAKDTNIYVLNYDTKTGIYMGFNLDKLLISCFFDVPIKGKIFQTSKKEDLGSLENQYAKTVLKMAPAKLSETNYLQNVYMKGEIADESESDDEVDYWEKNKKVNKKVKESTKLKIKNPIDEKKYVSKIKDIDIKHPTYKCTLEEMTADITDCFEVEDMDPDEECEDAHACFGCDGRKVNNKEINKLTVNNQIFDFDKFFINIEKRTNGGFLVTINQAYNEPFKHASYVNAVRQTQNKVIDKKMTQIDYVKDVVLEIKETVDKNKIIVKAKYYGISVF